MLIMIIFVSVVAIGFITGIILLIKAARQVDKEMKGMGSVDFKKDVRI